MRDPQREAQRWLRQADADLQASETLRPTLPALACFHAQQAAEKALKSVLYGLGEREVHGHSVADLGERVLESVRNYETIHHEASTLDGYYIPTRYPNGLPVGTDPSDAFPVAQAEQAIGIARRVLDFARTQVA